MNTFCGLWGTETPAEAKGKDVIFCGHLTDYKYYDMHVVIERALEVAREELN